MAAAANTRINEAVFQGFPTLRTDRLYLRALEEEDAPALFAIRSDARVMEFLDPQQSVEEAQQWIASTHARFSERGGIKWALEVPGEARFIGYAGIWRIFPESVRGEVGYALHPDYRGQGFATEAMRALVRFGFQELQVHSLMASINPGNSSSRRVLLKAGFQKEALLRDAWFYNGRFIDDELYGMLESDFTPTAPSATTG